MFEEEKYQEAVTQYDELAKEIEPKQNPELYNKIAQCLMHLEHYQDGIAAFNKAKKGFMLNEDLQVPLNM